MLDLSGKKVVIIGAKRSGLALAKLVLKSGGKPKISDQEKEEKIPDDLRLWAKEKNVALEFNQHTRPFIEDSDLVVLSPGVRFDAQAVQWASAKNIPVLGEIEFSYQFCEKSVIAVTGSNGKTTTVTLIRNVLERAGYRACLCGNVGQPFADFVLDLKGKDYVVLEISSFQMESLLAQDSPFRKAPWSFKGFRPKISVILNFSQNHLDRHKDLEEYFDAKTKIFLNQGKDDLAVLNLESPALKSLEGKLTPKIIYFGNPKEKIPAFVQNPNQLAVVTVTRSLGIADEICQEVFQDFKGVEHRLEWVRSIDGIDFINDSKATTAEAGGWALRSIERPIIMICGGKDKNIDYSVLTDLIQKKVKKMITIGEARTKIRRIFEKVIEVEECDVLERAVRRARESASSGDCVVLSPMCASFDQFKDYEERGKIFKDFVNKLK